MGSTHRMDKPKTHEMDVDKLAEAIDSDLIKLRQLFEGLLQEPTKVTKHWLNGCEKALRSIENEFNKIELRRRRRRKSA